MAPELIVWDFDGVLNRNIVAGRFIWADALQADLGLDPERLQETLFRSGRMRSVVQGDEDLRDAVADWLAQVGAAITADEMLDYWFAHDAHTDAEVLGWIAAHRARHVIGTNNETRRAAYIEGPMGLGARVEHVFASGRMGVAKPGSGFFHAIEEWSGVAPGAILLVDDSLANVEAARALGWRVYHFTDDTRAGLPAELELS